MTVRKLINELQKMDQDKVVVLTEPDLIGWDNIGKVIEAKGTVKISNCGNGVFQETSR